MLFVTLTYPRAYPGDWRQWKGQLHNWRKRLFTRCPRAAFVWKLEPQARGAPHFHLIIAGVPFLAKEWLSRSWYEVVGSGDPKHLAAGTNVQQVMSAKGVASYAAKYTAKAEELPPDWQDGVGRWWGVYGRERLGIAWGFVPLSQREFWQACRWTYRLIGSRYRAHGRGPPRRYSAGLWVILGEDAARRLSAALKDDVSSRMYPSRSSAQSAQSGYSAAERSMSTPYCVVGRRSRPQGEQRSPEGAERFLAVTDWWPCRAPAACWREHPIRESRRDSLGCIRPADP